MITEIEVFLNMRHVDVSIDGENFDAKEIQANKTMTDLFSADVTVMSARELKSENVLGKDGILTLTDRNKDRFFQGYISRFTQSECIDRFFIYTITITPYVKKQEPIRDVRIFQNMKLSEVIKLILEESGFSASFFQFRSHEKYISRKYYMQHRETNLDFIKRIAAEEGEVLLF